VNSPRCWVNLFYVEKAYGTIPMAIRRVDQEPPLPTGLSSIAALDGYKTLKYRQQRRSDFIRKYAFALRHVSRRESMMLWPDRDEMLGDWKRRFTGNVTNPDGVLKRRSGILETRVTGQATKRRKT